MNELRQRIEPIRSRKYLDGARGENCKLRFPGCQDDRETVVSCHVNDLTSFGMGQKADDISVIDGCAHCHRLLDTRAHGLSRALLLEYLLRGLQETLRSRIEKGVLWLKPDPAKPFAARTTKPRAPKAERKPIAPRENAWPPKGSRKLPTRKTLEARQ